MRFKALATFVVMLFLINATTGTAAGKVTVTNNKIDVEINNTKVPQYFIKSTGSKSQYKLQFDAIFEFEDSNGDAFYSNVDTKLNKFTLASWTWALETPSNDFDAFYLNGTPSSNSDFKLSLVNHLSNDSNYIKFDVIIENFPFSTNTSQVALQYSFTGGNMKPASGHDKVEFGDAGFGISNSAQNENNTVSAKLSTGIDNQGSNNIYLCYGHYQGTLVHDPVLSVDTTGDTKAETPLQVTLVLPVAMSLIIFLKKKKN